MTATAALFAALCLWLVIGAVSSFVMGRRGHDAWSWAALGALFGPIVIPLAIVMSKRERELRGVVQKLRTGDKGPGEVSLLVGIDGSPQSDAAACSAFELLGSRLGNVTFATVVDYDVAESGLDNDSVFTADARRLLEDAASPFVTPTPELVVLTGRPADALLAYALEQSIELLAVGSYGRGLSAAVLGSVAARVVRQGEVPVLVAGLPGLATTTSKSLT
ncbi:MAG: universal stress protein [Actinomycetota bacterium]